MKSCVTAGSSSAPIFFLRLVDLVLPVRLPELIDPAEAVVGDEDFARQPFEDVLQFLPLLRRQRDLQHRIARAEDLREHALREVARKHQPVLAPLARELAALVQRERHARLGLDEQLVLREEAGEQHAMPVLVGALVLQPLDALRLLAFVELVSELPAVCAQAPSEWRFRSRRYPAISDPKGHQRCLERRPQPHGVPS